MLHWKDLKRKGNPHQVKITPAMLTEKGYILVTNYEGAKVEVLYDIEYVKEKIEFVIAPLNACLTKESLMSLVGEIADFIFPSTGEIKTRKTKGAVRDRQKNYSESDVDYGADYYNAKELADIALNDCSDKLSNETVDYDEEEVIKDDR